MANEISPNAKAFVRYFAGVAVTCFGLYHMLTGAMDIGYNTGKKQTAASMQKTMQKIAEEIANH